MPGLGLAVLLALAAPAAPAAPPAAAAQGQPPETFEILNDTGDAIEELYFDPADRVGDNWLAAGQVLPPGGWIELPLGPGDGCRYQLEVRSTRGLARRAGPVDVCTDAAFALKGARILAGASAPSAGGDGAPTPAPPPIAAPSLDRGLPICPGDPRCRRKK